MKSISLSLLAFSTALTLAACNTRTEDAANADAEAAATVGNSEANLTPEEAGIFDKLFADGKPTRLALEQVHPNGGVLKVNAIQVKPTETIVNITYVNGHTRPVDLNWLRNSKRTFLLAENRKFIVSPPQLNEQIEVESGATMTGDLVFVGAVPQTDRLQLVLNESGSTSESASNPKFILDIPTPATAWSDDGSKKKSAV
ncbi:hypothetical protein [Sphingomonas qomolangmaensis]|uniref:DUF4352 domain-containing protein n=1 Tax=Sphingomonas qomolangmaensis TaxID=2918765 RepID=A0ABY5L7D4_9SPHN|nr:hypothetical protein [Sphingomonas qomolangmaensis]UUL82884.1 hypothetical protein NMP03_01190 [Sphingomonas qomolangmaensis]